MDLFAVAGIVLCAFGFWWWGLLCFGIVWLAWLSDQ